MASGHVISDSKQIANVFNEYFIGIGDDTHLNGPINYDYKNYMGEEPNCKLFFQMIKLNWYSPFRLINNLKGKTSAGIDNISNKLLKYIKNIIVKPIIIIINQMFKVGVFPDQLKISKVLPLYCKVCALLRPFE